MPDGFREAFVSCNRDAGGELRVNWLPLSRLVDLTSQMTFLDNERDQPRVFTETIVVVKKTLPVLS